MASQDREEQYDRVVHYFNVRRVGVQINEYLGGGTDGDVWKTSDGTAVKVLHRFASYANERDSYARLAEYGHTETIDGFWLPRMLMSDDELMIVEMDLMQHPPYIIDFAKVRIDRPPDFDEDTLADAERMGRERFEHNWPAVKSLLATLESYGIYYMDPNRGNITFPDMP
ncbi:MAG: hypothetical protein K2Y37_12800 [Pirellulales bacterium]|nr:hypothetical protein [Pirellulales bacterium]